MTYQIWTIPTRSHLFRLFHNQNKEAYTLHHDFEYEERFQEMAISGSKNLLDIQDMILKITPRIQRESTSLQEEL